MRAKQYAKKEVFKIRKPRKLSHDPDANDYETCSLSPESVIESVFSFHEPNVTVSPSDLKYAIREMASALKDSASDALSSVDASIDEALKNKKHSLVVQTMVIIGEQFEELLCHSPPEPDECEEDGEEGDSKKGSRKPRGRSKEPRARGPKLQMTPKKKVC
jgi:hypothetical protein